MKFLLARLVLISSVFLLTDVTADPTAVVSYEKPSNEVGTAIHKELLAQESISSVIAVINDNFRLPETLAFVFGGDDGPLYDPESNQILIPYAFIEEVKARFVQAKYDAETGTSVEDATMDALMHTLFHELAHALINMYDLPVLGKEEDAADALATFLLIQFFEDGQEIAISAADLFDLESADRQALDEEDFWDEHSLDAQRFYSTLCHVYGSDSEKYQHLLRDSGFSEDRAALCIEEYENLTISWLSVLKPHMKK